MSEHRSIVSAVQKLAGTFKKDNVNLVVGTVISVDEANAQCSCRIDNDVALTCNLQSGICDGLLILPVVGSTVVIFYSTYNQAFIAQYGDIDKFYLQVGDSSIEIDNDGTIALNKDKSGTVTFNGGQLGGLIKITELVQKLNNLENGLNGLADYVGSLPVPVSGAFSGPPVSASTLGFKINPVTNTSDIEDANVKH